MAKQRGNQNSYIEDEQTTQWPKENVQKEKQRSTKHTHKTKDRVTRTLLKTEGEPRCSGKVSSVVVQNPNLELCTWYKYSWWPRLSYMFNISSMK